MPLLLPKVRASTHTLLIITRHSPFRQIEQGSVGMVCKFGKYYKSVDPGLYKINLFTEKMVTVNIRVQVTDIPRQSVLTKDNVSTAFPFSPGFRDGP